MRSTVQRTILESLRYPNMTDRYEDLVEAHNKHSTGSIVTPAKIRSCLGAILDSGYERKREFIGSMVRRARENRLS